MLRFIDLKDGLKFLRSNAASKTSNSSDALLKSNISSFMDAIKILKSIFLKIEIIFKELSKCSKLKGIYGLSAEDKRNRFSKPLETMLSGN